jgi:hypothetical protein
VNSTSTAIQIRNTRNRRAGARWQAALRDGLRKSGFDIEGLILTGTEDEGDLVVRTGWNRLGGLAERVVIEAKAGVLYAAEFVDQALDEASNFARHRGMDRSRVMGIVVAKRRRKTWSDAYVLTSCAEYFRLGAAEAAHSAGGRSWPRVLCNGLRAAGRDAELIAPNLATPEGDLVVRERDRTLVVKTRSGELRVGELVDQAQTEAEHWARNRSIDPYRVDPVAIARRRGRSWSDAYVITTVEEFFGLDPYDEPFEAVAGAAA